MRIAFAMNYPPAPALSGGSIRSHRLARALAARGAELVAYFRADSRFLDGYEDHPDLAPFSKLRVLPFDPKSLRAPNPQFFTSIEHWQRHDHPVWDDLRADHARAAFDVIVCEQIFTVGAARALGDVPWVLSEQNVESHVLERIAEPLRRVPPQFHVPPDRARAHEAEVWAAADVVTCVCEGDAEEVRSRGAPLGPSRRPRRVAVVPNGVALAELPFVPPSRRTGSDVLFVGSFFWPPNQSAAVFLAREVMPRVWERVPAARLVLCGTAPSDEVRALARPGVVVTGTVPSVRPYLARACVYANAITTGAGSSLKTLEPLAVGLPLVSTDAGVRGYTFRPHQHYLPARDAESFAAAIVDVLVSRARHDERAERARGAVAPFDWACTAGRFAELVTCAARAPSRRRIEQVVGLP